MTLTAETLSERRSTAASTLAELERAQAIAVLDGEPFDAKRLVDCREELAALDAAEAESVRRDRAATSAERAEEREQARKAMASTLESYLAAVGRAEASAKAMVTELGAVESLADDLRRQFRLVGHGRAIPIALDAHETKSKHSAMLATRLRTLGGHCRYGVINWNSMPPIEDWLEYSRKYVAEAIQPIIDGE